MYASDFQQKLKQLNPRLGIYCGDNDAKPAGLYIVAGNEYVDICGVDKNELPEKTIFDAHGHIVKAGWRRPLLILLQRKLIDRRKAEKLFRTHFLTGEIATVPRITDPILKAIREAEERAHSKTGVKGMLRDDVMDISREIKKCSPVRS
jgi:hypothetical protein